MSIRVKLVEDQVLVIDADADAWARAYRKAQETNSVIEVHDASGRTLAINPQQILYWEETPDPPEHGPAAESPQAQPA